MKILLLALAYAEDAPWHMPAALRRLGPVTHSTRHWRDLQNFFAPDGPSSHFKIAIDASCVEGDLSYETMRKPPRPFNDKTGPWWRHGSYQLTHPKWSLEVWLPLIIARSRWYTKGKPNITVVPHASSTQPRHALSWCRERVKNTNKYWDETKFFFVAASSRGPCCDGGQPRDPGLLRHHFIGHVGEKVDGPWLFREARFADILLRDSQYKAPVSRDTAPRLRCFDERKDISVPPPVFLLRNANKAGDIRGRRTGHTPSSFRDVLVVGAEGISGGPEYDVRRALTDFYDPGGPDRRKYKQEDPPIRGEVVIRFRIPKANYTSLLKRSKYCLVTEGFSPWSPRLTEAVAHGCVPVFLSPLLRPPYASVLDYSKFSVWVTEKDVPDIPAILRKLNHAALFSNLMRVRPLFAFCVDGGGEDGCGRGKSIGVPGDGLPFLVYEMFARKLNAPGILLGEGGDVRVTHACDAATGACSIEMENEAWRCAMANRHACMCQKRVDNVYRYVGNTSGLKGHKRGLYHNRMVGIAQHANTGSGRYAIASTERAVAERIN